jgi:ATP-dependent helicase/nuclease subunit A
MLGRRFYTEDEKKPIIFHQDLGLGPLHFNAELRTKSNTLPHFALSRKIRMENLSEELRVLYVALTRAKEKLILTGCAAKLEGRLEKWAAQAASPDVVLPEHYRSKCLCFLDFIVPCLARHRAGPDLRRGFYRESRIDCVYNSPALFDVRVITGEALRQAENRAREAAIMRLASLKSLKSSVDYSGLHDEIESKVWWIYPRAKELTVPTKVSISEIKRMWYNQRVEEGETLLGEAPSIYFEPPQFMREGRAVTGIERGTAIHTVMERLDIFRHRDLKGVHELCRELAEKNLLTPEERAVIPLHKIVGFLNSSLAQRMRRSKGIMREVPFVMGLPHETVLHGEPGTANSETVLVHGIIDCFFEEEGGMVLVDYKSDSVTEETKDSVADKYRIQLQVYANAIERSTGVKVKEAILYMFSIDAEVSVALNPVDAPIYQAKKRR